MSIARAGKTCNQTARLIQKLKNEIQHRDRLSDQNPVIPRVKSETAIGILVRNEPRTKARWSRPVLQFDQQNIASTAQADFCQMIVQKMQLTLLLPATASPFQ